MSEDKSFHAAPTPMYLKKLKIINFKNYENEEITFSPNVNVFTGLNGSGKTNLLDAIYYLSLTKSSLNNNDSQIIKRGSDFFRVEGTFEKNGKEVLLEIAFGNAHKKMIKTDKTQCEKIKDHIGKFPVILITPYDTDIVREGSEERRKFFDGFFSQLDAQYLSELIKYNNILKHRNILLKQFFEQNKTDQVLIAAYDQQLLSSGEKIYALRKTFTEELIPIFQNHFERLTENKELVNLQYESQMHKTTFEEDFKSSLRKDILMQRTSNGIHKDDFTFLINGSPLKTFGSQGQQKSFVIALKLAQYALLNSLKQTMPLLLLDDIFDKLDDERISKLMQMVSSREFGQLFITDARTERTIEFFKNLNTKISIFKVQNGSIEEKIE